MTRRRMIALAVAGVALGVAGLAATQLMRRELFPVEPGSRAPDFRAVTLDEEPRPRTMDDYRGKVVLLNIWATWCAPCRIEMPSIEQLHKSYAQKGLEVVAVSVDDPGTSEQIRDFVEQYGLTFDVLHDPEGRIREQYQTTGYPETVVIGRDGVIRRKLIGASDWNSPATRALIERLLGEPATN